LPRVPAVAPAPTRAGVTAAAASPTAIDLINQSKELIAKRQGTIGNITTTPLGDASYGGMSFASFGAVKAA
jgi:hypothetical protein